MKAERDREKELKSVKINPQKQYLKIAQQEN